MAAPWTELDRRIAQALAAGGGLGHERVQALNEAAWARRLNHNGSAILGAAIAEGVLSREQADQLLGFLLRSSSETGAVASHVVRLLAPPVVRAPSVAAMFPPTPTDAPPPRAPSERVPAARLPAPPRPSSGSAQASAQETLDPHSTSGAEVGDRPALDLRAGGGAARSAGETLAVGFGTSPAGFGGLDAFGASPAGFGSSPHSDAPPTRADLASAAADDGIRTIASGDPQGSSSTWPDAGAAAESVILASRDPAQRYELLERSPDAGGERLRARDKRLAREVELRLAPPGADPRAFLREARLVAQLDHPSIPKVHDLGQLEGRAYVAGDRLVGRRLDQLLASGPARPPLPALLRVFLKLGGAVAHAHARGAVHGDIHTTLIMVGDHGEAWLSGWGRAVLRPTRRQGEGLRGVEPQPTPLPPPSGHAAPEVAKGELASPRSDVWALGAVLHTCLTGTWPGARLRARRTAGAPRELLAVVRKALAPTPAERYASADDLVEDVRAFLDGRAVSADREGVVRGLLRVARGHPIPAAIVGVGVAALLGVAGLTARRVHLDLAAATRQRADAAAARERAEKAKGEADKALARVRLAEGQAQERRALAATLGGQAQTAAGLDAAAATLERLEAEARRQGQPDTPEELAAAGLRRALWVRLLFARGTFHLRRATPPDPARALADLREVVRRVDAEQRPTELEREVRADALLSAYLAARRLPGIDAEAAQATLLRSLTACDGIHGRIGQVIPRIERMEVEAEDAMKVPAIVPRDLQLEAELEALVRERGDLALTHELYGRYLFATTGPGLHRSVQVTEGGVRKEIRELRGSDATAAYKPLAKASHLDPLDPLARVLYQRVMNEKFGRHTPWRWVGGWALDQVVRSGTLTPRPDARLAAAEYLLDVDRPVAAALLLEPVLSLPEEGRAGWSDERAEVQLLWARGRLAGGALPEPVDLATVRAPGELEGEREALLGWHELVTGKTQEGLQRLLRGAPRKGLSLRLIRDLLLALTDPRADARAVYTVLRREVPADPAADRSPVVAAMLFARAVLASRSGAAFGDDLARAAQGWPGGLEQPDVWSARAQVATSRMLTSLRPNDPASHTNLLLLWAQVDVLASTEPVAVEAQQAIVARLERMGRAAAAREFAALDAVDEVYVPRVWIPPEANPWRFPQGGGR